VIVRSAVTGSN